MTRLLFRRPQMLRSLIVTVVALFFSVTIFNDWKVSYHGVGPGIYCSFVYAFGLVGGFAYLEHRARKTASDSVVAVASRTWLNARFFTADVIRLALIPLGTLSAVIMIGSAVLTGRGYLEPEYVALTAASLIFAIVMGWLIAFLIENPIIGVLLSYVLVFFRANVFYTTCKGVLHVDQLRHERIGANANPYYDRSLRSLDKRLG
ncbi:hypothetical protein [Trueperella bialowiezensis]|uniref:Uncharacterized protein n=1 Tax=Trueperella bialowiezensis TaxID=312285 RepID=A0A3S4V048_9ACTO|nr:hypothetical protein [Trueperella bialowiezensis]VEI14091.1 Uncharacterised protein [Trueperella bialowiezensis]